VLPDVGTLAIETTATRANKPNQHLRETFMTKVLLLH